MLFHSLEFFVFFPLVVALFFATPSRHRWALLLVASYVFYGAWKPEYLVLIATSTGVDYVLARKLGTEERAGRRKLLLVLSLATNLGLLVAFKYLGFFAGVLESLVGPLRPPLDSASLDFVLPVGISFYTFQTIGYTIDVYRREREPEHHLGRFALYVSFFPQLVAGPIERSVRLLPQFRAHQSFDFARVRSGLGQMLWGFFKKLVIADRAAFFVSAVYDHPGEFQGLTVVVATYLFAFQIYCDFSGYTDIAIGAARVLGFELMENFDRPYASSSVTEFWRRWHISLSTWFRDYVYIPLGGSRLAPVGVARNLAIVFLLSGLWHGANWTFVFWGGFHGMLLVLGYGWRRAWGASSRMTPPSGGAGGVLAILRRYAGIAITFHLVCLGWVFFRAESLDHVADLLLQLPVQHSESVWHQLTQIEPRREFGGTWADVSRPVHALEVDLCILGVSIVLLEVFERRIKRPPSAAPTFLRHLSWAGLSVWVVLTAVQGHTPFIYFQF